MENEQELLDWGDIEKLPVGRFLVLKNGFQYSLLLANSNPPARVLNQVKGKVGYQWIVKVELIGIQVSNKKYVDYKNSETPDFSKDILGQENGIEYNMAFSKTGIVQLTDLFKKHGIIKDGKTIDTSRIFTFERKGESFDTKYDIKIVEKPKPKESK